IVIVATISIAALAFVLSRIMMRRQQRSTPLGVYEDEARIDEEGHSIRDALRFMIGPFPLSVALHVLLLLILIATIKVQSARDLRRKGLDVVLVIDDTGTMDLIINDVRDRMDELVMAIHRLVPIARVGIVVFGGRSERVDIEPLTISSHRLQTFLTGIGAKGH